MKILTIIIIGTLSSLSLCQKSSIIYGTYRVKDVHRGECLSNLIIKRDNSFKYQQKISNNQDSILGTWQVKSDTLFLNYNKENTQFCLKQQLKILKEKENIELRSFQKEKSICEDCTNFIKINDNN